MLTALIVMLMNAAGVAPTPAQMQKYELDYRERMHHVHIDFSSTRTAIKQKSITIGLGYEYHIDRQFNGVSLEVLGQKIGKLRFQDTQGGSVEGLAGGQSAPSKSSCRRERSSTTSGSRRRVGSELVTTSGYS